MESVRTKILKNKQERPVVYLALSERGCESFGKIHSNKIIEFLLIVYFPGTKNYQSVFLFLNSVSILYYMYPNIPHEEA